ncbi:MAG: anthranilate phosphoribosyltransferase [Deltaproteobacteria bacterium]|nr:anthranilate phosphoribosyltransferase [Deltaproteobacteria bacterium]
MGRIALQCPPVSSFPQLLERLLAREELPAEAIEQLFGAILDGALTQAQIAAAAVALRAKGETAGEIAAAARALRARAKTIDAHVEGPILDTCGTGGDSAATFNVSTLAAVVVAAAGVHVAKHGNRAISSRSGSADLLEALGIPIEDGGDHAGFDARLRACLERDRIAFFFAPRHHSALRHAAPVRRELGVRTIFNLLGPLSNPAGATHQLLGVFDDARRHAFAEVLRLLGVRAAWVVHGLPVDGAPRGLDEVSPAGPTHVSELRADGTIVDRTVEPRDAGLEPVALASLAGGDAIANAAIARSVLAGERNGARVAVVLNAACALLLAGRASDLREARERAEAAIDRGDAAATLDAWREHMRGDTGGEGAPS